MGVIPIVTVRDLRLVSWTPMLQAYMAELKAHLDAEVHETQGERLLWHGFPDESMAALDAAESGSSCFWDLPGGGTRWNPRMETALFGILFMLGHVLIIMFFAVWQGVPPTLEGNYCDPMLF